DRSGRPLRLTRVGHGIQDGVLAPRPRRLTRPATSPRGPEGAYRRGMIIASHALIYSDDAPATRAFLRDVLRLPFASDEVPEGQPEWLIFRTGPSELGVHPTTGEGGSHTQRHHSISLVCDDLPATMADLASRGAEFTTEP